MSGKVTVMMINWEKYVLGLIFLAVPATTNALEEDKTLGFPLDCTIGVTCFLQNLVDLDTGPGVRDALCQANSYNTHKGIDIRVPTLKDMARGVDVLAVGDGVITAMRDGVANRLVVTKKQATATRGVECGNGLLIRHAGGLTSQYCHMQAGSFTVSKGAPVRRGDVIGKIGLSGFSAFPHLHLSLRRNKVLLDPLTGSATTDAICDNDITALPAGPFGRKTRDALLNTTNSIIGLGLSDRPITLSDLVKGTPSPVPTTRSNAFVGWGWVINAAKGDRMRVVIEVNDVVITDQTSKPLVKRKADWTSFAGRRRTPPKGDYKVMIFLLSNGEVIQQKSRTFVVK